MLLLTFEMVFSLTPLQESGDIQQQRQVPQSEAEVDHP